MDQFAYQDRAMQSPAPIFTYERMAISLLFFLNGFVFGSWAVIIPEFARYLGINSANMGVMIFVMGTGALISMPLTGAAITRFGSSSLSRVLAISVVPALLIITIIPPDIYVAGLVLLYFGAAMAGMDVAMNANAVAVEKSMRRSIMSSCHAFWSLGGLAGSIASGLIITYWGQIAQGAFVSATAALLLIYAWRYIYIDDDEVKADGKKHKLQLPTQALPWFIGVVALFGMIPEGAILDWGTYYMQQDLQATVTLSGIGFAAFSLSMALMRFSGDFIRDIFGSVKTLRICVVIAMLGLLLLGQSNNPYIVIFAFAVCGIGISNMIPIIFSMAGNIPGVHPGVGLSIATTMGYSAMLFMPSIIGIIAEKSGFGIVFSAMPVLLIIVLLFSRYARYADRAE